MSGRTTSWQTERKTGRPFRILNILDEYTHECLVSVVARRLGSQGVILLLAEFFLQHGVPLHSVGQWVRVHRPQVAALAEDAAGHRARLALGERLCRIVQWQDQFLNGDLFYTLKEA